MAPLLALTTAGRRLLAIQGGAYAALAAAAVVHGRPRRHGADPFVLLAAFPVMHLAWGSGFLVSLIEDRPVVPRAAPNKETSP